MHPIGSKTLSVFESQAEAAFIAKLAATLRDAVPALANEPEPAFSAQIRLLAEQARGFGLRSEQEIGSFAVTAGLLGAEFVEHFPGAREILESSEPAYRKCELLEAFTLNLFELLEG